MRLPIILTLIAATAWTNLSAAAAEKLSPTEKAKVQTQIESLQKQKLEAGAKSAQQTADMAKRQAQQVDQKQKDTNAYIDKKSKEWGWVVGPDAANQAGAAKKQAVDAAAQAEKAKIAKQAQEKAAAAAAAAKKQAENINQSVEGLKSQVSKEGKYGLQPKGSNLYVRQYGK